MVVVGTISFVNHDCQPNCKFVQEKGNKVSLQAIRDIKLGEELTIFYGNDYFERENKDCECRTCEGKLEGAFRKLKSGINSSLCTVPFMPFLKCPSAMPFLKCPSAMPFLNCPSRIRFLKMPFLNYFPPKDALPQNNFPKKCPSLTCPPTIPHQRQCKHCNN